MIPLGFNRNTAQGQQALAEIAAVSNPLVRTIQRSPRAADMPPDPVPVFKSDPRFPSNIVNEVHQDLRRQARETGGVTGNNDAGFNYETRMQAGENIVPTGLNANQAVAIVDDAIAPIQTGIGVVSRGQASDARGIGIGTPSKIDQQVAAEVLSDVAKEKFAHSAAGLRAEARANQLMQQPRPMMVDDDDDAFLWSSARSSNTAQPATIPIAKPQTEDDYYDQEFANQAARNPYGLPDVQRNPYADQATVMQDNRGSGRVDNRNILNKTLATGAAVGGGLGAMALINNALGGSSGGSTGGDVVASPAPTPRAHFVIDKANNTAQSFIDRGDGQLQPYKTMDVQGARDAWSKAKQAGWSTSFE